MSWSKVRVIFTREYLSRVRTAGFWISTVAIPVLMGAWMVLPSLIMAKSRGAMHLAVVDETGRVAPALERLIAEPGEHRVAADFRLEALAPQGERAAQQAALDRRVLADEIDAWLWIDEAGLAENEVLYHGRTVTNFMTLEALDDLLSAVVREQRLAAAGYDVEVVKKLVEGIGLEKVRVTEQGAKADLGVGNLALAIGLFTMLYMAIMIYGNIVMQGVLEEKASRIVEVVAASTRPSELMAGKLLGICAAALTQLAIWIGSAVVITAPGLLAGIASLPAGVHLPEISPAIVVHFFALFLLGFLLYASFYALIGAAFNSAQEAQQLATFGVIFIIVPWMVFMPVLNDPDSTMAVTFSVIPMFAPMIMMLRIAIKMPPAWQLALAYALLVLADLLMVWICARVYRVGILMYGKKPSLKEIWRWARYA
jgi:ABC-2 type transport system permease protein